ncbi:MAG: VanZ family protein [Oscillospiraceae bacterium]|jgi:glycopeptide antibiotics resistance protein|nr:VanZ family protein [Oscillospiraceae bacterium]
MKKLNKQNTQSLTLALFVIYLLALFWLVLFKLQFSVPIMEDGRVINLIPKIWVFSETVNNVIVFIPFGVYICMIKDKWSFVKKLMASVGLTVFFEATQFIFAIGRSDITDVLSNTLGALIGIGAYAMLFKLFKDNTNRKINAFAALVTVLAILSVALLLLSNRWVRIR